MGLIKVKDVIPTPNPLAMKFALTDTVTQKAETYTSAQAAASSPVASKLFGLGQVTGVLIVQDFVTVNKKPDASWDDLTPRVRKVLDETLP